MASCDPDQFHLFTGQAPSVIEPVERLAQAGDDGPARLTMAVLGSGSGGNGAVLSYGGQLLLIDAGFGPRATAGRLKRLGATLSQVRGICLTHLDADHLRPAWFNTLVERQIPLYVHERHMDRLWSLPDSDALADEGLVRFFTQRTFSPLEGMSIHTVRLAHDAQGTCAFRIQTSAGSIGYATDLGHVPDELVTHFAGVDLLAIESNYDKAMQVASSRPYFLKQRIMGGHGHLSNEQSFEAVQRIFAASADAGHPGPGAIVLLHRSRQCNCPGIIRELYARQPALHRRLSLSEQHTPLPWLEVGSAGPWDVGDIIP